MRRPRFIAEQSRRPSGLLGHAIAAIMVRETAEANRAAVSALAVAPGDHVLDVGCGGGHSIALLVPLVGTGTATGIDPSDVMVTCARKRNYEAIENERAMILKAGVEALPFEDATFDAALSIHTLYFWPDLDRAFAEIARVLRPGGTLALVFRTSANDAARASFPEAVYTFRTQPQIVASLAATDFEVIRLEADGEQGEPALLVARRL